MIPVSKRGGEAGCGRCVFAVNFRSDTVRCFSVVIVSISLSLSLCRFIGFHGRNCWHNGVGAQRCRVIASLCFEWTEFAGGKRIFLVESDTVGRLERNWRAV